MEEFEPARPSRLSRIDTLWSVVHQSQGSQDEQATTAQQQLLDRYGNAIKRYLLGAVKNQEQADELFQDFALKFVNGEFRNVDETRGRFRSYVKTVLYRMVALHYRKQASSKERALEEGAEPQATDEQDHDNEDRRFIEDWRQEILDQAWESLEDHELATGVHYFSILNLRVNEPELSSEEFAARLSEELGNPVKAGTARVSLHRAREKFAGFVINSIAQSLREPTRDNIEDELIDLSLIEYCREALKSVDAE